jgi:cysteine desulfurase
VKVYLDNAATTEVDKSAIKAMLPYFNEKYGNASSQHLKGQEARMGLEESRESIARSIGAGPDEIIFTSGGTEGNNLVLKGLFFMEKEQNGKRNHIITTKIEHDCILNACRWLEKKGARVTYLDVDKEGFVNPETLKEAITPETLVVSIIHGNNEIGTIQDLEALGKVCREKGVYFHTDACQSYTKTRLNVRSQNLDFVTLNSHKIHGPKGVGALYIKKGIKITPLMHGGGHEFNIRSGTENVSGIVGFAKAVQLANKGKHVRYMSKLRDKLIDAILKIPNTRLNGPEGEKRLCNNINVSFNDIEGESIGAYLDAYGVCSSTGSACSSHSLESSHVLKALGLNDFEMNSAIRLSLSRFNTEKEINYAIETLNKIVTKLRKISPVNK